MAPPDPGNAVCDRHAHADVTVKHCAACVSVRLTCNNGITSSRCYHFRTPYKPRYHSWGDRKHFFASLPESYVEPMLLADLGKDHTKANHTEIYVQPKMAVWDTRTESCSVCILSCKWLQ